MVARRVRCGRGFTRRANAAHRGISAELVSSSNRLQCSQSARFVYVRSIDRVAMSVVATCRLRWTDARSRTWFAVRWPWCAAPSRGCVPSSYNLTRRSRGRALAVARTVRSRAGWSGLGSGGFWLRWCWSWWSRSGWWFVGRAIANQGVLISAATVTKTLATRHYVTAAPHGLPVPRPPPCRLMRLDRY